MAAYRIVLKRSAAREIDTIEPLAQRRRIVARIERLASDPRPEGAQRLAGHASRFRLRQGPFRILYEILDDERLVVIVKVGHRREVYR